jgi:hypothetical protein
MNSEPRLPDQETIDRHIAKLRELVKRMDGHILDLDELNAQLAADLAKQKRRRYNRVRQESQIQAD